MHPIFKQEFISQSIYRLDENTQKIKNCLDTLSEEEVWKTPNESANSIGNLILHLCGNIRQYAVSSLGGTSDLRERDKEFARETFIIKHELFQKLEQTAKEAIQTMDQLNDSDMIQKREVQGFHFSDIGVVLHVVEHYSYHTGQIALLTKLWKNKDLGFYAGIDLNAKNN